MDGILSVENFDKSLAEGLMLLTPFSTTEETSKAFTDAYVAAYGIEPNQFAADAYDAIYAIKAAMEEAKVNCMPHTVYELTFAMTKKLLE